MATKVKVVGWVPGVGALSSKNTPIRNMARLANVIPETPVFEVIAVPPLANGLTTPSAVTFGSPAPPPYLTVPVTLLMVIRPPGVMAIPVGKTPMFEPTVTPAVPSPASKTLSIALTVTVMAKSELEAIAITPAQIKNLFIT